MGQKPGEVAPYLAPYLEELSWDESLSLEERIDRGPFQSAFGVGRPEAAAEAVARARREASVAEAVFNQVKEQAVYALIDEKRSIRDIAQITGIPKSEVGRISRRLKDHGDLVSGVQAPRWGAHDEVRDHVRAAWGHR